MTFFNRNERILVTGAGGMAGSAILNQLVRSGFRRVTPVTRKDADLTDRAEVRALFRDVLPERVVHSAALVYGLGGAAKNHARGYTDNVLMNTHVIEAASDFEVKKIVVMGSNTAYPSDAPRPYREETLHDGPVHGGEFGYGSAKRTMLDMLEAYKRDGDPMKFTYVVSGNLYGPRDKFNPDTGHVLPTMIYKFSKALDDNGNVELWGNGTARRDFLFSGDLARYVERFIFDDTQGALNTGFGKDHSIKEVAKVLSNLSGVSGERVFFDEDKPNGRLDTRSDLSRLQATGLVPTWPLEEGLAYTWDWYRDSIGLKTR